jgi:hypothetical protein
MKPSPDPATASTAAVPLALVGDAVADGDRILERGVDQEAPGQGDVGGHRRPLVADRVLGDLDEEGLALGRQGGDVALLPAASRVARREEAVAPDAEIDEGGGHARYHPLHAPEKDFADPAGTPVPLYQQVDEVPIRKESGAHLAGHHAAHDLVDNRFRHDPIPPPRFSRHLLPPARKLVSCFLSSWHLGRPCGPLG